MHFTRFLLRFVVYNAYFSTNSNADDVPKYIKRVHILVGIFIVVTMMTGYVLEVTFNKRWPGNVKRIRTCIAAYQHISI